MNLKNFINFIRQTRHKFVDGYCFSNRNKLFIIAIIVVFVGVSGTQAQSKMINGQGHHKSGQNDSISLKSEKNKFRGYYNVTSLEVLNFDFNYLKPVSFSPVPGISTINGYRFSRDISLGLGLGFDYIGVWLPAYIAPKSWIAPKSSYSTYADYTKEEMSFIPVFADFRLNLTDTPVTPYLFVDAGYDISLNHSKTVFVDTRYYGDPYVSSTIHNFSGAFYGNLGFGLKFHLYKRIELNTAVKFTYRGIKYTDDIKNQMEGQPFEWFSYYNTQSVYTSLFLPGADVGITF